MGPGGVSGETGHWPGVGRLVSRPYLLGPCSSSRIFPPPPGGPRIPKPPRLREGSFGQEVAAVGSRTWEDEDREAAIRLMVEGVGCELEPSVVVSFV